MICCGRCGRAAPLELDDLFGDPGGDPTFLPALVPPDGWIGDPDADGLLCCRTTCATAVEIEDWNRGLAWVLAPSHGE